TPTDANLVTRRTHSRSGDEHARPARVGEGTVTRGRAWSVPAVSRRGRLTRTISLLKQGHHVPGHQQAPGHHSESHRRPLRHPSRRGDRLGSRGRCDPCRASSPANPPLHGQARAKSVALRSGYGAAAGTGAPTTRKRAWLAARRSLRAWAW